MAQPTQKTYIHISMIATKHTSVPIPSQKGIYITQGQKGCDKVNHPAFRKEQTKREPKLPFMFSTFGVITSLRILRH